MCQAVNALFREGARRVIACGVHGVLSGPAIKRLQECEVEEVIISNSIPLPAEKKIPKITVLSIARVGGHYLRSLDSDI